MLDNLTTEMVAEFKSLLQSARDCSQPLHDQKMAEACLRGFMSDNASILLATAERVQELERERLKSVPNLVAEELTDAEFKELELGSAVSASAVREIKQLRAEVKRLKGELSQKGIVRRSVRPPFVIEEE